MCLFYLQGLFFLQYAIKKSVLYFSFDPFSNIGKHISSVQPGNVVASSITIFPFLKILEMSLDDFFRCFKSGRLFFIGVGPV